jgi:peptidyl-prolyl cis-trans isomerase D
MSLQQAKSQIENLLKEEKIKKELEDIKSQIEKEKSLNLTLLQEKHKGKIKEIKNEKYMQLQVDYGLSPEDVDKVVKTGKGFSPPFITDNKLVIFYVSEIIPPDKKEYEKAKGQFKPLFENQKFNDIVSMLIDKLKNDAGIKINKRVFE